MICDIFSGLGPFVSCVWLLHVVSTLDLSELLLIGLCGFSVLFSD